MRKATQEVIKLWLEGKKSPVKGAIWTDGKSIYSYETCICTVAQGQTILNETYYSPTTSTQQREVSTACIGRRIKLVSGLKAACKRDQLIKAARL